MQTAGIIDHHGGVNQVRLTLQFLLQTRRDIRHVMHVVLAVRMHLGGTCTAVNEFLQCTVRMLMLAC
jgi:hypothetical protein